jgi:hypothetical protein
MRGPFALVIYILVFCVILFVCIRKMFFGNKVSKMVRKAVAEGRYDQLYEMVPADDGGQTYEMKCKICGELGNVLASKFEHAKGCPVDIEEKKIHMQEEK